LVLVARVALLVRVLGLVALLVAIHICAVALLICCWQKAEAGVASVLPRAAVAVAPPLLSAILNMLGVTVAHLVLLLGTVAVLAVLLDIPVLAETGTTITAT
jgi:hypothetical protein